MRKLTALLPLLLVALSTHAQLVPKDAVPEKVADGYKFTEGPAVGKDGGVYFTDIPAGLILRYDPETGETKTVIEDSGNANGLAFHHGILFFCAHGTRMLGTYGDNQSPFMYRSDPRIEPPLEKAYPLSTTYNRKQLNSPNDLAIDKNGNIYFTDPRYGNRDSMQMQTEGVYYFDLSDYGDLHLFPGPKDRPLEPKRIDADLVRPNGIVLSPDESILYVADHGSNWIYAYDINEPGKVENKRKFAQINDGRGKGSDGMCIDRKGRLYATGHEKVWIFEPTGQLVATIPVGKHTTNVTFGADGKTLYITANNGLYRIVLNTDTPLTHADKE